jgi:hypothetical protein
MPPDKDIWDVEVKVKPFLIINDKRLEWLQALAALF